jgi:serine/threonine-protein kinase
MMVGDVLADRYELEELVGTGGMSSVYRAYDRVLERRVALKILHQHFSADDEYVQRFLREARTVASLSHPNIVTVIDRGEQDAQQFIVFEYVDGENLKRLIERNGPAPVDRALELAIEIARGLESAHERGLVHRDVKPQNVLLNGDGRAKVTDFGIAREIDVQRGMTQTGTVLGTSDYISPEQAQGLRVDEHTDVYSLGVVLYELLAGELPFRGDNFVAVAMSHINDPAPSVLERRPDVPLRIAAAIDRALAKSPDDRWPTMSDFRRELEECLREVRGGGGGDATVVLAPPRRRQRPRRAARRRVSLPTLLVLAGIGALAAALAVVLTRHDGGGGPARAGTGKSTPVHLSATTSYDPFGSGGGEHNEDAHNATDGDPGTYWETHHYAYPDGGLGKAGVGLVLDAGSAVTLHHLTVSTDTPGFTAAIRAGDSPDGGFHDVSGPQTVGGRTTFDLSNAKARYFVVWITNLGPHDQIHVNEVTAD